MHYFSFNIKDYIVHTVHLTNEQDLAYRRLLDLYYETECYIPVDTGLVSRRLRVGSDSVEIVLAEFFIKTSSGYKHARCDEEIAHYHVKADTARANGKKGGKPKKSRRNLSGYNPVPIRELTSNQEPVTSNQDKILKSSTNSGTILTTTNINNIPLNHSDFTYNPDDEVVI